MIQFNMYASALSFKCTMCLAFLMCQYLCAKCWEKIYCFVDSPFAGKQENCVSGPFWLQCYVIYSRCLFLTYVPVVVTLFNGDKSPLLGAFCINSVGVIVTLILCISHIAFKCCIKHQVNDIQGVPEKKRAPFSNFGFTNLCDNYGPWTPRRFCYCDLCTYLILSMYDEIKGQLFLVYWPSSDQTNQVTSH